MFAKSQFQIKENAMEVQDYMKDLYDWEDEIKAKDKKMRRMEASGIGCDGNSGENCPPVRGATIFKPKEAPEELRGPSPKLSAVEALQGSSAEDKPGSKHPAVHTYKNYDRWDRFDVDEALKKCDKSDGGDPQASTSQKVPPPVPDPMEDMKRATNKTIESATRSLPRRLSKQDIERGVNEWRVEGNNQFKEGKFVEAIQCYTHSIDKEPTSMAYANRGMARLRLGEHKEAEEDCTSAILIDAHYLKAYQRRAVAREALGDLEGAAEDLEFAVRLEPTSEAARKGFLECLEKIAKAEKLKPIYKRVRIPAQVVRKQQTATPIGSSKVRLEMSGRFPDGSSVPNDPSIVATGKSGKKLKIEESQEQDSHASVDGTRGKAVLEEVPHALDSTSMEVEACGKPQEPIQTAIDHPDEEKIGSGSQSRSSSRQGSPRSSFRIPTRTPKNSAEFEAVWKSLRTASVDEKSAYLSKIEVKDFPKIFKSSLSPPVLVGFIHCALCELAKGDKCEAGMHLWISVLDGLTTVPRFGMVAMCVGKKEKVEIRRKWDAVNGVEMDERLRESLTRLRTSFGI